MRIILSTLLFYYTHTLFVLLVWFIYIFYGCETAVTFKIGSDYVDSIMGKNMWMIATLITDLVPNKREIS